MNFDTGVDIPSASLAQCGGRLKRSVSSSTLFKEDVLGVSIFKSPPRKRSELERLMQESVHIQVKVKDLLLDRMLRVECRPDSTFLELKERIQSYQGHNRLRIIPSHIQQISFNGEECADEMKVRDFVRAQPNVCLALEPRVTELVSFFLASVTDMSPAAQNLSETILSSAQEEEQPFFGEMEGIDGSTTSTASSQANAVFSPCITSPSSSPRHNSLVGADASGLITSVSPITIPGCIKSSSNDLCNIKWNNCNLSELNTECSWDSVLSAKTTPTSDALYFDVEECGSECESNGMIGLLYNDINRTKSNPLGEGMLDSCLLHGILSPGGVYSSQLHIVFRDRGAKEMCIPLLQKEKLGALAQLVSEVQGGLRYGHAPEVLESKSFESDWSCNSLEQDWNRRPQIPRLSDFDYGDLVDNCCGGTYIMRNAAGAKTAIFKPTDEEPYAPFNPKGFTGMMDVYSEMKSGIKVGGGAARECAAYLLDHESRAKVPCTTMLRITHTTLLPKSEAEVQIKVGSLQRFHEHDCTAEDIGTSLLDVEQVHYIGILDVRLFNMDRNSDNLLVNRHDSGGVSLIPIDHGYVLPSFKHLEDVNTCWLHWPQAKKPFSANTLSFIENLNADDEMEMLKTTLGLPEECLITLYIGTTLIQKAALAGLTLHEIGNLMMRPTYELPSEVELAVKRVLNVWTESDGVNVLKSLLANEICEMVVCKKPSF